MAHPAAFPLDIIVQALASESRCAAAIRRAVRLSAGCVRDGDLRIPVVVVPGRAAPQVRGRAAHHVTPNGSICHHPNAYRRAFGRPQYVCSTIRVEVGLSWLVTHCPVEEIVATEARAA